MKEYTNYQKGTDLYNLTRRAWRFNKRIKKDNKRQFENLVDAENSNNIKEFKKQMKECIKTLEKLFTIFLNQNLESEKKKNIEYCLNQVNYLRNSQDVHRLVLIALSNTEKSHND